MAGIFAQGVVYVRYGAGILGPQEKTGSKGNDFDFASTLFPAERK
jgi:hypothetical protein